MLAGAQVRQIRGGGEAVVVLRPRRPRRPRRRARLACPHCGGSLRRHLQRFWLITLTSIPLLLFSGIALDHIAIVRCAFRWL